MLGLFTGPSDHVIHTLHRLFTTRSSKMDTLGIEATPEEVDLMIDEIDQDNNGEIDFEGKALRPSDKSWIISRGPNTLKTQPENQLRFMDFVCSGGAHLSTWHVRS